MFENILKVEQLVVLELELDELRSQRKVSTRGQLIGKPELGPSHDYYV